jgi:hypothetical protein
MAHSITPMVSTTAIFPSVSRHPSVSTASIDVLDITPQQDSSSLPSYNFSSIPDASCQLASDTKESDVLDTQTRPKVLDLTLGASPILSSQSPAARTYIEEARPLALSNSLSLHPNTSLLFNASTPTDAVLPPVTLHMDNIQTLLKDYPDPAFVDMLCNIATHGARIGYEGPLLRVKRSNHASAYVNHEAVSTAITKELAKGRLRRIDSLPAYHFCSPIGVVPKKVDGVQTGWRVIFDLSCPTGRSVNDGIPLDYGSIKYESLSHALCLVAKAGRNAKLLK